MTGQRVSWLPATPASDIDPSYWVRDYHLLVIPSDDPDTPNVVGHYWRRGRGNWVWETRSRFGRRMNEADCRATLKEIALWERTCWSPGCSKPTAHIVRYVTTKRPICDDCRDDLNEAAKAETVPVGEWSPWTGFATKAKAVKR